MVKMEAFDDPHFMHHAVRVGHTDHTGSIVFPMACIFDLKKKFLCNRTLIKIVHLMHSGVFEVVVLLFLVCCPPHMTGLLIWKLVEMSVLCFLPTERPLILFHIVRC